MVEDTCKVNQQKGNVDFHLKSVKYEYVNNCDTSHYDTRASSTL